MTEQSSSSDDPILTSSKEKSITRRQAMLLPAIQGSFLAAALLSGAPPALAADIAKQLQQLEKQFKDDVNSNGAPEKHTPEVKLSKGANGQDMVKIVVPHVMDPEKPHWIQAIWLKEEKSGDVAVAKVLPATEAAPPTLVCGVPKGVTLTPYLYCNLHGLWKGESFTAWNEENVSNAIQKHPLFATTKDKFSMEILASWHKLDFSKILSSTEVRSE